jgi:signal transduction histidine kinase
VDEKTGRIFRMKRSWQAWLLYVVCVAVALPALGWLTHAALVLERAEHDIRRQGERDERIRLAAWRLDTMLMPIVAPEAARSYDDHARLVWPDLPTAELAPPAPGSKYVLAYFQLSPQAASFSRLLAGDAADLRRLDELRHSLAYADLIARLPSEWLPGADSRKPDVALVDQAVKANAPSQAQQAGIEYLRRQQANQQTTAREIVQQRAAKASAGAQPGVREGVSRPLWAGDELLLARRVQHGDGELVQGCWFDWAKLRGAMHAEVADLVPKVDLAPVRDSAGVNYAHALATLPVELVVPRAAEAAAGWTPMRVALAMAWAGLLAVAAAAAALLAGMISLARRREAFVSAVTHELRTPLTTFRMYAEMLGSGMVDETKRRDYLRTLKVEADRLWHLVENVLAYARLERAKPAHRFERLTIDELCRRVEPRLVERAQAAEMELACDMTASTRGTSLVTDPAAVEQILFNLVDNACKYAAQAVPRTIRLHAAAVNGRVEIRVRDFGAGIAPADVRRLFQPFSKSAERAAASAPGVGLGLALCRQLARQLRGELRYEPGAQGTTFVLTLPRG